MSLLSGWRLPLRIARREALRHRGRSLLVVLMIALPVLGVTAADVVMHTSDVSSSESVDRRLGSAAALVRVEPGTSDIEQGIDPDQASSSSNGGDRTATAEQISDIVGGRLLDYRSADIQVVTDKGKANGEATEVDLGDPATDGLFDLTSGRLPRSADEVVVNQAMLDEGYAVGDPLDLAADGVPDPTIVGVAESAAVRTFPVAYGLVGSLGLTSDDDTASRSWLVVGDEVTWDEVEQVNKIGGYVFSRYVVEHPPPASELPDGFSSGPDSATVAVLVLVVVMALIEVVLLAGPAFAVGARRQQRSLALMSATGGTPRQSRRVVVGGAVVLGGVAAVLGVVLGILVALAVVPFVRGLSDTQLGPFEVPWLQLLGVAAFGMVSALLAAVVPARIASRMDVVAVLAGRRGDRPPSLRSPVLGLVLMGVGVVGAAYGAGSAAGGEFLIAASAIPSVLGMILLVPVVLAVLARLSRHLPLTLRYAVRDAARHRTRTVPAVAAVAATVAGVVALAIANTSDEAENEATYTPSLTSGAGQVQVFGEDADWPAYRSIVEREIAGATTTLVQGVDESGIAGGESVYIELSRRGGDRLLDSYGSAMGSSVLVSDDALPPGMTGIPDSVVPRIESVLRSGGAVAFTTGPTTGDKVVARVHRYDDATQEETTKRVVLPAVLVHLDGSTAGPQAVLSTEAAERAGLPLSDVGLVVTGAEISEQQQDAVSESIAGITEYGSFYVERGYQNDSETVIVLLILAGLGAALMLGGTLTATFLALSDARPDLATLAAVGASPGKRRGVAAAYAVVVGFVGALLGAVVGFIPGIAITYPLTQQSYGGGCVVDGSGSCTSDGTASVGPFLDIPWLLVLGLVVVLPLLTAAIVGLTSRARLPLVARLD